MTASLDAEVTALARHLAEAGDRSRSRLVESSWWSEHMLEWAMSHPTFKTQLFRFVDVFPATVDDADVLGHLSEYFEGSDAPRLFDLGLGAAEHLPLGRAAAASLAHHNIRRVAQQFIVGAHPEAAVGALERLWRGGSSFTVDLLGEKTLTEAEADRYATRVEELLTVLAERSRSWPSQARLEHDDLGLLPRVNVSVKPTALASRYAPLSASEGMAQAAGRLRVMLRQALRTGAFVNLDAEHFEVKDLTLDLFREVLAEPEFAEVEAGVVVQAYTRSSWRDLSELIAWSEQRRRPITVRLVKGAYWDTETITAQAAGWPVPVYLHKEETDANYERCTRLLHEHHGGVRAAFGTHNLRSIAYAVQYARDLGIPDHGYEIQLLYGMAEPVHTAVRRLGLRLRVYAPVGELVPGMAYLVRRLLENTANESFVRRRFVEGRALDELVAPPGAEPDDRPPAPPPRPATEASSPGDHQPEPVAEWRDPAVRARFGLAVEQVRRTGLGADVPALIGLRRVETRSTIASVDPAEPSTVVASSASCRPAEAEEAVAVALAAWPGWRATAAAERADVLFGAAAWMRARRNELAALEVFEAGKPWPDADADVCEAIDFLEYYGRRMLRMDAGAEVDSPPGESNVMRYRGRGVCAVISPWNFPLAIPTGMVAAALVTGNTVILKPAEQTPAVASKLVEALLAAGLPEGVLGFLPGLGGAGAHLVEHPAVSMVAFTGSLTVGLGIVEAAAVHRAGQRQVKRVVAEMGGKNAIIVDADADLDQAVPIVATSAFGYSGQKCSACSRLIVVDRGDGTDQVIERLVARAAELRIGHPSEMGVDMGPLIDADAHARVRSYVDAAASEGKVVLGGGDVRASGYFVAPTIVADVEPASRLATEEIFGPVLATMRAGSFDEALELANRSDFALTAGVVSRWPSHIDKAVRELRAGNVYVNRPITGAVVGRQPFGGSGLSGVGSKAGGPDYLLQFVDPVAVSENTLRQGFAPGSQ